MDAQVLTNAERQARFQAKRNADAERKAAYLQKEKQRYKASFTINCFGSVSSEIVCSAKESRRKCSSERTACRTPSSTSASQTRVKTLEKRAERSAKKPPTTPRLKTKALLQAENLKVTKASKVRKTLEFHHALVNEIQSSETADGSKHKFLSTLLAGEVLRNYRLLSRLRREANVRGQRKRSYRRRGTVSTRLANAVHEFYLKESVSKICPGKKDTITRYKEKQRRVLTDTLSNLHRKFLSGHRYVSFTTFWRLKPFWVLPPRDSDRQTCLCKVCENFKLLSKVLHKDGFLRLRIVHELAVNASYYLDNNYLSRSFTGKKNCLQSIASFSDHYLPDVHDLSKMTVLKALYEKELKDKCKPRSYMGMWQMFGLASVLQMRICSVYPKVSAYSELRTQLHRVIESRHKKTDDVATILWTSTRMSIKSLSWVPNHFVPLLAFNKA
ncbi:hypothetical protein RRG08_063912 [Elysia crispata]|uniref:Vertnin n=1 Tax=Elysia crispata TaxID=231223 RepID=A0AAE0YEL8_9GAST|nr:hypothetical protein RRG08_063912 [Elysia crispata]